VKQRTYVCVVVAAWAISLREDLASDTVTSHTWSPRFAVGKPLMSTRNIRCTVTEPTTGIAYDVDANYRCPCSSGHDARQEHLCDLTLRARPVEASDGLFTVCDLAAVPTPVLVAIQARLRAILARAAATPPVSAQ